MSYRFMVFLFVASSLLAAFLAVAETTVGGTIATMTWTKDESPYRIIETLIVPVGETLTIEPGAKVLGDGGVSLVVRGKLVAIGTETDSIRFLPSGKSLQKQDYYDEWGKTWDGVVFEPGSEGEISYTRFSGDNDYMQIQTGGSVTIAGARVKLSHCVIKDNRQRFRGSGLLISQGADVSLTDCSLIHNSEPLIAYFYSQGGGIYASGGSRLTIDRCVVRGNSTRTEGGAGMYLDSVIASITSTVIGYNRADPDYPAPVHEGGGGFLITNNSHVTFTSCLITGNSAGTAGCGGYIGGNSVVVFDRCTIANNRGVIVHGGLVGSIHSIGYAGLALSSPYVTVMNSIMWGDDSSEIVGENPVALRYSVIASDTIPAGPGNLNADPLFADMTNGDYSLLPGSPCIDSGDPNSPLDPDDTQADIGAIPFGTRWTVSVRHTNSPATFHLEQNSPNPFNPCTTIRFTVSTRGVVNMAIYDINGRLIRILVDGDIGAGYHEVVWDGTDATGRQAASGLYIYSLTSEQGTLVRRMVLLR